MLPIILFILKLLGILLLILLGLILGALLLVLFVPVRYQIEGSFYDRLKGKARITWLLHIVSVTAAFEDDFSVIVRLFGFRILRPAKESREDAEDMLVHAMEATDQDAEQFAGNVVNDAEKSGKRQLEKEGKLPESNDEKDTEVWTQEEAPEDAPKEAFPKGSGRTESSSGKKRESAAGRLSAIFAKLKFFFSSLCDKLKNIKEKKEEIQTWISDKNNQKTIRLLFRQAKKLVRHLLPKKGKGEVVFGFDDPYTTGQVLTAVSAVYPFCHKQIAIYPVFDRQVFTAEGYFKGRIRLGTLLLIAGRMLLDKNFRVLLRRWLR